MKLEQTFTLETKDLREIISEILVKQGLRIKEDDVTVSINTDKKSISGPIENGRSWGYLNSGVIISCEVESIPKGGMAN